MGMGFMRKFSEVRGVAAIGGFLATTAVIWAMAGAALAAGPSNTVPPFIGGTLQAGKSLTVSNGTWTSTVTTGITFLYAWTSGGLPVGANSPTYPVASTDIGNEIAVTVTAIDSTGSTPAGPVSAGVVPVPPANTVAPTITGVAVQQGQPLTANTGTWTGTVPITFFYAWTSGGLPVGTDSATYTPTATDVGKAIAVSVIASNAGGSSPSVGSASTPAVLPLPPANTAPPAISGTPAQGQVLTMTQGGWVNTPTAITEQWEDCAGLICTPIPGQTGASYTVGAGDVGRTIQVVETASNAAAPLGVPAASARSATASASSGTSVVAFSQNTPTTNQAVTLVATVISNSGNANPHGSLSFFKGSDPVPGCAGKGVNGGQTITIVCQAGFPAGIAQISAAYVTDPTSLVGGSSSDTTPVSIGKGPTSVSLAVTPKVAPGGRATYVATLAVPVSNDGPTLPSGSIEFLDRGQPIGACASEALSNLTATCSVGYASRGTHSISALYIGDSNFTGSTSSASSVQIVKGAAKAPLVRGSLGSTLGWRINFHPRYSELTELDAFAVPKGTSILVQCLGEGCPFAKWHLTKAAGTINLLSRFRHRHLRAGTRVTVRMTRRLWIGKYYSFTIRPGRPPLIRTTCLAPSTVKPGVGCTSHST
jgi:Bacterial Ig-like domain (group 3)